MDDIEHPEVLEKFQSYPSRIRKKLPYLRQLIIDTARVTEGVGKLEETLRWGEPSYIAKGGSTIRMDWKKNAPDQYVMLFHCQTSLVDTFRELYRDEFRFEGNRAIVFYLDDTIAVGKLRHCVTLALTYKKIKHLPMLGA